MKRVLLTGGGGFVASHTLIHLLHNTDWEIICTDSFRHRGKTDRIAEMVNGHPEYWPRVTVLTHDLTVPFSEQFIAKLGRVDYIISMASESHVDRSISDPRPFIENNVALTLTLLEYARYCNICEGIHPPNANHDPDYMVEKFLNISTDEVYGPAYGEHGHVEGEKH